MSYVVLKIEREYSGVKLPASDKYPFTESHICDLLGSALRQTYRTLSGRDHAQEAAYRSAITQTFYDSFSRLLGKRIAPTSFFLVSTEDRILEAQIQPFCNGPTLRQVLRWNRAWEMIGKLYTLTNNYKQYGSWIYDELELFTVPIEIDHRPDNLMLIPATQSLVLVDVQEMDPKNEWRNQIGLKFVQRRLHDQLYGGHTDWASFLIGR